MSANLQELRLALADERRTSAYLRRQLDTMRNELAHTKRELAECVEAHDRYAEELLAAHENRPRGGRRRNATLKRLRHTQY